MPHDWDDEFVLRRVEEDDQNFHRVYKHSYRASDITNQDNYFAKAPLKVKKEHYRAVRTFPDSWLVTLQGQNPSVEMAVFQLRRI